MAKQTKAQAYDLVIVGGGMVGASLACALEPVIKQGLTVALIEAFDVSAVRSDATSSASYDARSTALSHGSRQLFEGWQLWPELAQQASPIRTIHVSDKGRFGATRMHAHEHNIEALGYVVENQWLGRTLLHRLQAISGLDVLSPAQVDAIDYQQGKPELAVKLNGKQVRLSARLVVIADGGHSPLCQQLGIEQHQQPYQQLAIIANVTLGQAHQGVAYERFTPEGPLAMLPMTDTAEGLPRSALVLTGAVEQAEAWLALDDAGFLELVQQRFGYRLGQLQAVGKRNHYELALVEASEQVRPGVVVVGNAAHTLHPVAGQGFNLALRGIAELAQHVSQSHVVGNDIGALAGLLQYLESRQADQHKIIQFSDLAMKLFANNDVLLSTVRDMGLVTLDLFAEPRKLFARQAMGLGG